MSRSVCLIGNSHLAALALGWRQVADRYPGVSMTFFGSPAGTLRGLRAEDGRLVPGTPKLRETLAAISGGIDVIDTAAYDEFWLVGMGFGSQRMMAVYEKSWAEDQQPDPHRAPVSTELFRTAVLANLTSSLAMELHRRLRSITDKPIRIMPEPMLSAAVLDTPDERFDAWRLAATRGEEPSLAAMWRDALAELRQDGGVAAEQPAATLASQLFSDPRFGKGSIRLTTALQTAHTDDDYAHMNADYGAMVLAEALG